MRNLLIVVLLTMSFPVLGEEFQCGDTDVTILKTGEWESTRYQVKAQMEGRTTELWLNSVDHINSKCVLDSESRKKILINSYCGGSGCSKHAYIIINARTLLVELVPVLGKSNLTQAEEILGKNLSK